MLENLTKLFLDVDLHRNPKRTKDMLNILPVVYMYLNYSVDDYEELMASIGAEEEEEILDEPEVAEPSRY